MHQSFPFWHLLHHFNHFCWNLNLYHCFSLSLSVFLSLSLCLFLSLSMSLSLSLSHFTIVNFSLICKLFFLNVTGSQKKNETGTESQITKIISRIQKWETMKSWKKQKIYTTLKHNFLSYFVLLLIYSFISKWFSCKKRIIFYIY